MEAVLEQTFSVVLVTGLIQGIACPDQIVISKSPMRRQRGMVVPNFQEEIEALFGLIDPESRGASLQACPFGPLTDNYQLRVRAGSAQLLERE